MYNLSGWESAIYGPSNQVKTKYEGGKGLWLLD